MKSMFCKFLFPQLAVLFCLFILTSTPFVNAQQAPNIIILFADDMGYGDLSCYGNPTIKTPNIDALAGEGIRFTSFVPGLFCVPSSTQLLTGGYSQGFNFVAVRVPMVTDGNGGLPGSELKLAEGLKEVGSA